MNISKPTIIGYNPSDTILNIQTAQAKQATGQMEYDGSKIDNLSLQSGKLVSFVNQDGNSVRVYLDNQTIDKLQSKFGNDSFASTDNNTLNASDKAEEYLAGFWQVAQNNILSADKDDNGMLVGNELLDVKTNVGEDGSINTDKGTMSISISGLRSVNEDKGLSQDAKNVIAKQLGSMTVDTIFNQLLNYDKNNDGNLNIGELISLDKLNNIYNKFANSGGGLALEAEVQIGNKTVSYEEYMPSAEEIRQTEKNKREKELQDGVMASDEKRETEDKKIEKTKKAAQEAKAIEQTDNTNNIKQNTSSTVSIGVTLINQG